MKKSVMLGLVIMTGVVLAMTGCKSTSGMKHDDMSSGMKGGMSSTTMKGDMSSTQHPAGCTCAACSMKK